MAVLDKIRRGLNNWLGINRVRSLTSYFNIGNTEVYVHIDTENAIKEGYNGNTAVYAIVNKDAEKFASIPPYVYAKGDKDRIPVENELSKLLARPNEYQGADSFFQLLRSYKVLTGEGFIWLNRGALADGLEGEARKRMPVLEMYVLPPDHITVIPDPANIFGVTGYYLESGQRLYIPKEDIIHWKNPSLLFDATTRTHLRGQSPLSAGYKTLQQNNSATDAAVRMYQNDGAKGLLYNENLDSTTDPTQRQEIRSIVDRRINNNDLKGSVATLQGKWGYLPLGMSNTDLALLEGKDASMKELCFLLGTPYALFDPNMPWADQQNSQKNWVTNSIIPATRQCADELNRVLPIAFNDEKSVIAFDPSDLPEMQEDMKLKIETMMAGVFKPNDILEAQGYDRDPNPVMDEVWVRTGFTPISQVGNGMEDVERQLREQGLDGQD